MNRAMPEQQLQAKGAGSIFEWISWTSSKLKEKCILHEKKLIKPRVIADIQFRKQAIAPRMGGY
jgi:hypothetical protein